MIDLDLSLPCSAQARQMNIPIAGSAPYYNLWFLIEAPVAWGKKAADDIHDSAFRQLEMQVPTGMLARRMLIKRPLKPETETLEYPLTLMIAHITERDPALYVFTLETPTDIGRIKLTAILNRDPALAAFRRTAPIFCVCINARRDPCCGQHGQPILDLLAARGDITAWGCSHIGGHRFAPTGIIFPHGICYGQIEADELGLITSAAMRDACYPRKMRGRVCYDEPTQAASIYLRTALDLDAIDAIRLEEQAKIGVDQWEITFGVSTESALHQLEVARVATPLTLRTSCDADAPTKQYEYRVLDHVVL